MSTLSFDTNHFDIISSHQKDEYYRSQQFNSINSLLKLFFKNNKINSSSIQLKLKAISDIIYYSLTTGSNRQTLGQENYFLIHFDPKTKQLPTKLKRFLFIWIKICLPFILNTKPEQNSNRLIQLTIFLVSYLIKLNYILFFFGKSTYYTIEDRLTSLKTISIRNSINSKTKKMSFALGYCHLILLIGQFIIDTFQITRQFKKYQSNIVSTINEDTNLEKLNIKCALCLDYITFPTSTPCGHIFCWKCINCYTKVSFKNDSKTTCPTCRVDIEQNKLLYIFNFTSSSSSS
jgi:peroxin-10